MDSSKCPLSESKDFSKIYGFKVKIKKNIFSVINNLIRILYILEIYILF